MKYGRLVLCNDEREILEGLMEKAAKLEPINKAGFDKLKQEMTTAQWLDVADMPTDVVRINSSFDVETPFGIMAGYKLVIPKDSNPKAKKLSIVSPMGSAVIGYAAGDTLMWHFPAGEKMIKIMKVENNI